MAVTRSMARKALVEYGLQNKTNAEIDEAMAAVDQEGIIAEERAKYTVEVWDRETPINGVDPATVVAAHHIPEHGTAYMIREGERIVYFQARSPYTGEVITPENVQGIAEQHLNELAETRSHQRIIEAIVEQLDV